MGISKGVPKNCSAWARPLDGACLTPQIRPSHMDYRAEFVRCCSETIRAYVWRSGGIIEPTHHTFQGHSRSSELTDTYDFLLVIHSNHGLVSCRHRDKWRFRLKIANFPTRVYLTHPMTWFPLEFCNGGSAEKSRIMSLPESENFDDGCFRLEHDGQTDRNGKSRSRCHHAGAR